MPMDLHYLNLKLKHGETISMRLETLWCQIASLPRAERLELMERIAISLSNKENHD